MSKDNDSLKIVINKSKNKELLNIINEKKENLSSIISPKNDSVNGNILNDDMADIVENKNPKMKIYLSYQIRT